MDIASVGVRNYLLLLRRLNVGVLDSESGFLKNLLRSVVFISQNYPDSITLVENVER